MTRTEIIGASIPAAVLAGTFLFRWVTIDFDNDYFMHVAWAAEMLRGQWPVRDFVEPGFILQTFVSYAAFRLGGYQLAWEAAVACALLAASAVLVYLTCRRMGLGRLPAVLAAVVAVAAYPRLYAYPKAFVYPAALWAMAGYINRPGRQSLMLLSALTAIAFLFRHDHGAWIGVVVSAGLVAVHRAQPRMAAARVAAYGCAVLLLASPWLAWVAASGHAAQYFGFLGGQSRGLVTNRIVPDRAFAVDSSMPLVALAPVDYPRIRIRWAGAAGLSERQDRERRYALQRLPEPDEYRLTNVAAANVAALVGDPLVEDTAGIDRSTLRVPGALFPWLYLQSQRYAPLVRVRILPGLVHSSNAQAWLTWVTFVLPWLVLAAATVAAAGGLRRNTRPAGGTLVFLTALLSLITYQTLVRGSPDSRLGDVAPMTGVLLAWMAWTAWRIERWPSLVLRPVLVVFLAVTVASAFSYGRVIGRVADAGGDGPTNLTRRALGMHVLYGAAPLDVFAPPGSEGLPRLSRWLHECTGARDRVSIIGFEPQVFVVAERGFAGGMAFYDLGWTSSESDQRLTIERWSRQPVPFVLAMDAEWPSFAGDYALIRAWIERHYEVEQQSRFGGNKDVTVWRHRTVSRGAIDQATGLPCPSPPDARHPASSRS